MPSFAASILSMNIVLFLIGLAMLIKGSDLFVESAARIARRYGLSEMVIGLTLVSIGTSMPELATDVYASWSGAGEIVIGDLIGSNITNIALILGLAILLSGGIDIPSALLKRDVMFMLGLFILIEFMGIAGGGKIGWLSGVILLLLMCGYICYLLKHGDALAGLEEGIGQAEETPRGSGFVWLVLVVGMTMVFLGAKTLVDNVLQIVDRLGVNPALVAATVVAFGTSVPELAVTITGFFKKRKAIALGNIIGSCIFNLALIMGACAVIGPVPVDRDFLLVITPLMIGCGALLAFFMRTGWRLARWEGGVFLAIYAAFIVYGIIRIG